LVEAPDSPFASLDLSADGSGPGVRLLRKRAEFTLRRGLVEYLAEPFDQGEVERLGHPGGAILSDAPPARSALQGLEGRDEGARCRLPPVPQIPQRRLIRRIRTAGTLELRPCRPLPFRSLTHGVFPFFPKWLHLVEADPGYG
jgi:hypothetical protein